VNLNFFADLGGRTWQTRRLVDPEIREWSVFNPSIGLDDDGNWFGLFRSSNYVYSPWFGSIMLTCGIRVENRLYFSKLSADLKPEKLQLVEILDAPFPLVRGVEDAKLYKRGAQWYFTAVIKERAHCPQPRIATFELLSPTSARFLRLWDDVTDEAIEKNWMAASSNSEFEFVYGPTSVVVNDSVVQVRESRPEIAKLRGTSNLVDLHGGDYLAVVHETWDVKGEPRYDQTSFSYRRGTFRVYSHRFARYSSRGALTAMTDPFYFNLSGIEYASGLVIRNDEVYVAYGQKDLRSHAGVVPLAAVLSALKNV
jgi:hypothetical protein